MQKIYTGLNNANIYTSCGQDILNITYDTKTNKGNIVFKDNINYTSFLNFCISFINEYNKHIYIKLTAPKLLTEDKTIKNNLSYSFTFNQVWEKTFDENNNLISFESY